MLMAIGMSGCVDNSVEGTTAQAGGTENVSITNEVFTPQTNETQSTIPVFENPFTPIMDTDNWDGWQRAGISHVRIPRYWDVEYDPDYPYYIVISGEGVNGGPIVMSVYLSENRNATMESMVFQLTGVIEFSDRHHWNVYEFHNMMAWMGVTIGPKVSLYHGGDTSLFTDNEELILTIISSPLAGDILNRVAQIQREEERRIAAEYFAANFVAGVTLENFGLLRNGMSLSQVEEIFGVAGTLGSVTSTTATLQNPFVTTWRGYTWDGPHAGSGVTIVFENGRLTTMTQSNLR